MVKLKCGPRPPCVRIVIPPVSKNIPRKPDVPLFMFSLIKLQGSVPLIDRKMPRKLRFKEMGRLMDTGVTKSVTWQVSFSMYTDAAHLLVKRDRPGEFNQKR